MKRMAIGVRNSIVLLGLLSGTIIQGTVTQAARSVQPISVVASTNVYADIVRQIGGTRVILTTFLNNPNSDPHLYESSATDATALAHAALVIQNGLGYDRFMEKLEQASTNAQRIIYNVGERLGYKAGDNPHIWYNPSTMPQVATFIAQELSRRSPADRAFFMHNLAVFNASLKPWTDVISQINTHYHGTPIENTEPVFDYAIKAMGLVSRTPVSFALALQEGTDPAPQDVQMVKGLLTGHKVYCFFHNKQVVQPVTTLLQNLARENYIPIVGVYETMPASMTYQSWMLQTARQTQKALSLSGASDQHK